MFLELRKNPPEHSENQRATRVRSIGQQDSFDAGVNGGPEEPRGDGTCADPEGVPAPDRNGTALAAHDEGASSYDER